MRGAYRESCPLSGERTSEAKYQMHHDSYEAVILSASWGVRDHHNKYFVVVVLVVVAVKSSIEVREL